MLRIFTICAVSALLSYSAYANRIGDPRDEDTRVTVNYPITVQGTLLQPGQYEFRRMVWPADREVVEIRDGHHNLIATKLARPAFRDAVTNQTQFTFYETPRHRPPAVRTWFSPGYHYGFHFAKK
ncbi:MAG TPA: hypothetical protein VH639_11640 [Bryobacteraceae bacterium]|jgi:hypothetical protein